MRQTRREFLKTTALATGATSIAGFPLVARAQASKVVVWWNKGYYPEEDAAMQKIVKEFENRAKVEVDLSFTAQEDLLKKINAALIAHRVPDVAFCFFNDWQVVPKYGWTGQLADCSDIVSDLKPRYNEKMLAVAHVLNSKTKKRAYYGLPIEEVFVWVAVTYATVIVFEVVKIWQASERLARDAFLGSKKKSAAHAA